MCFSGVFSVLRKDIFMLFLYLTNNNDGHQSTFATTLWEAEMIFIEHLIDITLETAPWLLIGLLAAGLIKAWIPEGLVARWLGGPGMAPVVRAALVGAPLPLCSCSVIPMALELRRNGTSNAATVSFLVATPETGVDSVTLSWTLLGPLMTVIRPVAAVLTGIFSGLLTLFAENLRYIKQRANHTPTAISTQPASSDCCCATQKQSCSTAQVPHNIWQRTWDGLWYAMDKLWNDIAPWLAGGLLLTALVQTWLPPGALQDFSREGWLSMLVMVHASMPVYVCATASTPMAAAMLYSGLSPGMTLAFLIAGPATNLAPLAIIKRELGSYTLTAYLLGILLSAVCLGLLTDWLASIWHFDGVSILADKPEEFIPLWFAITAALMLIALSVRTILLQIGKKWPMFRSTTAA